MLVVAVDVVAAPNDKQQLEPMLGKIDALLEELDKTETLLADAGDFSAATVEDCAAAGAAPLIATGRQPHHPSLSERFETAPSAPKNPTPVEAMARRQEALCPAQTDPGAGVRHHQIGARVPPVFLARSRQSAGRVEPRDHGVELEADVRPRPRLMRLGAEKKRDGRRSIRVIITRSSSDQASGDCRRRQNHSRRSAAKIQSDGLLGHRHMSGIKHQTFHRPISKHALAVVYVGRIPR